jgi:hypothetical protein
MPRIDKVLSHSCMIVSQCTNDTNMYSSMLAQIAIYIYIYICKLHLIRKNNNNALSNLHPSALYPTSARLYSKSGIISLISNPGYLSKILLKKLRMTVIPYQKNYTQIPLHRRRRRHPNNWIGKPRQIPSRILHLLHKIQRNAGHSDLHSVLKLPPQAERSTPSPSISNPHVVTSALHLGSQC